MQYGTIPGVGKDVSRLVLGSLMISDGDPHPEGDFPVLGLDASFALLDAMRRLGVNAVDSAHGYGADGASERTIGRWMEARRAREEVVVVTKGGVHKESPRVSAAFVREDLETSLDRLRSDYIDLYIVHHDDPRADAGAIVHELASQVRTGTVHAYGFSNWTTERVRAAIEIAEADGLPAPVAVQPHFSLAEQVEKPWGPGSISIAGPAYERDRAWLREHDLAVLSYSSLCRGFLSGRFSRADLTENPALLDTVARRAYLHEVNLARLDRAHELAAELSCTISQLTLAFLYASGLNLFPIVGAANEEEVRDLAGAFDVALTPTLVRWLDEGGER